MVSNRVVRKYGVRKTMRTIVSILQEDTTAYLGHEREAEQLWEALEELIASGRRAEFDYRTSEILEDELGA